MVDKKLAVILLFFSFLLSTYTSFSYFKGQGRIMISPLVSQPGYSLDKTTNNDNNGKSNQLTNEQKTEECPLNGEMLTIAQKKKWQQRRPLGVMIENHLDARPQSGLQSADVIYEAVAEGGITRFLAIFYCKDASYIGPVRSARIYFIKILQGYGDFPLYAHVGGANTPGPADALGYLKQNGWVSYNDLNQFSVPFPYFWRDYERLKGRATEHTVYSSTAKLWQYAKEKRRLTNVDEEGNAWDKNFIPWKFKDDAAISQRGNINKIDFGFWNIGASDYSVQWVYVKERNTYLRFNGGKPHLDKNTGKQLETKNVVILLAKESPANDGYEGGHILYQLTGEGEALIFQDGQVISGSWMRKNNNELIRFFDDKRKEVSLVRGQVFVEILPSGNKVTY
jgi:hypothetical protein